jgi:hypothetical protein
MAGFNADGSRRVARATRRIEQTPRYRAAPPKGPRVLRPCKYAIVATAITAASGTTLGRGTGTLQLVTYAADDSATYTSMGEVVPIYHGGTPGIASGRLIIVEPIDGRLNTIVDYC